MGYQAELYEMLQMYNFLEYFSRKGFGLYCWRPFSVQCWFHRTKYFGQRPIFTQRNYSVWHVSCPSYQLLHGFEVTLTLWTSSPSLRSPCVYSRLESSSSEWMDLSMDKSDCDAGLYKSHSSMSVCSVASTFLPSLPPDSFSTTSTTHIGKVIWPFSPQEPCLEPSESLLVPRLFFQEDF